MKNGLFTALLALCLCVPVLASAQPAAAPASPQPALDAAGTAPSCAVETVATATGTAIRTDAGSVALEDLLASLTPDPSTRAIDSGICCGSSSDCDDVPGYWKRCSRGQCNTGPYSCQYSRK